MEAARLWCWAAFLLFFVFIVHFHSRVLLLLLLRRGREHDPKKWNYEKQANERERVSSRSREFSWFFARALCGWAANCSTSIEIRGLIRYGNLQIWFSLKFSSLAALSSSNDNSSQRVEIFRLLPQMLEIPTATFCYIEIWVGWLLKLLERKSKLASSQTPEKKRNNTKQISRFLLPPRRRGREPRRKNVDEKSLKFSMSFQRSATSGQ